MTRQKVHVPSPPKNVPIKVKWVNQNPQLKCVFFLNARLGWAAGEQTLLSTTDGGHNWTAQPLDVSGDPMLIQFLDENVGWIPMNWGLNLLETTDGGKTWSPLPTPPNVNFYQAQFVDVKTGWGASNDAMYRTTDGKTWQPTGAGLVKRPFFFANASYGWASTAKGAIAATTDGGKTWQTQTPDQRLPLLRIFFLDQNRGWAARYQLVQATSDGGKTWETINTTITTGVDWLQFVDPNVGWACGGKKLLGTRDGGRTWVDYSSADNAGPPATAIWFIDAKTGWCSTEAGTIVMTKDGGKTWQAENVVPPLRPGKALRAKDYAGQPKIPQVEFGDGYEFKKILFPNKTTGWAIGTLSGGAEGDPQGLIGYTQDGGKTWTTELIIDEPYDMYFSLDGSGSIYTKGYFAATQGVFHSIMNGRGPWITDFAFTDGHTITLDWKVALRGNSKVAVKHVEFSPGTDSNFGPLPLKGLKKGAGGVGSLKFSTSRMGIQPKTKLRFRIRLQDPDGVAYTHEIPKVFVHR